MQFEDMVLERLSLPEHITLHQLKQGVIRFDEDISDYSAARFLDRLEIVVSLKPKEIWVHLMSPGGDLYPAFAMYDGIRAVVSGGIPVHGLVTGYAASAACMLVLQACIRRVAQPHARLLLHDASSLTSGKLPDLEDSVKEVKAVQREVLSVLSARMNKTPKEAKALFHRKERWIDAQRARELGVVDEVEGAEHPRRKAGV